MIAPPPDLIQRVRTALSAELEPVRAAVDLPAGSGSYLLLVRLAARLTPDLPKFAGCTLSPGWYLYAGSAHGPGGIAARAGRHLRIDKPVRWHIDHLTIAADQVWAAPVPGATECDIAGCLADDDGFSIPVAGFGSSDCRTCEAHLLAYDASA